jgi:hypothetical protein
VRSWTVKEKVALSLAVIGAVFLGEYTFNWAQQQRELQTWKIQNPQIAKWAKENWLGDYELRITLTYRVISGEIAIGLVEYLDGAVSDNYVRLEAEFDRGKAYSRKEGRGVLISVPDEWEASDEEN